MKDYETFFKKGLDMMMIADGNGSIININSKFCEVLGYNEDDMVGKNFHEYIHPDDIKSTKYIEKKMTSGDKATNKVFNFTNRYRHKSGSYIYISWRCIYSDESEKYYATATDNKNVDFISKISHELKTPLNAIMGYTQLVMLDDNVYESNRSNLNEIMKNANTLLAIIDDLLEISNMDLGNKLEDRSDAYSCISTSINQLRGNVLSRGLRLKFNAKNSNVIINIKETKFIQIMSNLLSNAIKYNKPNGSIDISCEINNNFFILKIKDTGIGIPKDKLYRLYTPFDRLDVDGNKYEGSGLGLSIVHKIVTEYNGKISCDSEYGNYTVFTTELNIVEKNVDDSDNTDIIIENTNPNNSLKILYIEDNKMNYTLIANILKKKFGNSVDLTISQNGIDGINNIKNNTYDLILLDYMLPDINGDIVLENIVSNKYVTDLNKVVFTTAVLDPIVTNKLQSFGVNKFLYKPIDVKKFFNYLDECVKDDVKCSM